MKRFNKSRRVLAPTLSISTLAVGVALAGNAFATQFKYDEITGSFDTTISYGISVRTQDADKSLIGIANGGTARSVNEDDGDRNYRKKKPFANVLKATHDLEAKYHEWGMFVRGTYFVDFENRNNQKLGPIAKDRLGQDYRILDAFISRSFDVGGHNLRARAGQQVISWGESTFIPNGINVANPVDLAKLRTPGAELKEGFIPTKSLWGSFELNKSASVEAYYLFNFDKTKIDPRGSYWSNNDFASDDATQVFVSFGRRKDLTGRVPTNVVPPTSAAYPTTQALGYGPFDPAAPVWAPRGADRDAKDAGQYGVAFHYLASNFNNTEFGAFFQNYHSRTPFASGFKGTPTSIVTGGPLQAAVGQTGTASYVVEYPENIRLIGLSFNTQGPLGTALQGEFSYRPNQPLQVATPEVLLAALGAPNLLTGFATIPGTVGPATPFGASAAALVPNGTFLQGWQRVKMSQFQTTATKGIPHILGADQAVLVGEIGFTHYSGLPSGLKFNGPGVFLPATAQGAVAGQAGSVQSDGFVTENSWGYRLVGRLEYPNLLFSANVAPRVAFNHDVKGVSQTFNEGVKSVSLGTNFDWQRRISLDLSYTSYFGGRTYCGTDVVTNPGQTALAAQIAVQGASYCSSANPIRDRDFYSVVVAFSF